MIIQTILALLCAWSFLGVIVKSKYSQAQLYQTLAGLAALGLNFPGIGIALWFVIAIVTAIKEVKNGS